MHIVIGIRVRLAVSTIVMGGLLLLSACGSSVPSESLALDYLKNYKGGDFSKFYEVKSLTKTNGKDGQYYLMEYDYQLECLRSNREENSYYLSGIKCEEKGQIITGKGSLLFEKTEKGWRVAESARDFQRPLFR